MSLSTDITDDDLTAFLAMCADAKVPSDALKRVMISESNMETKAICMIKGVAFAGGLSQLVNSTLHGLGYTDGVAAFAKLSFQEQLVTIAKFYKQPMLFGRIHNQVQCYVSNWLPAYLSHASDPAFVYARRGTTLYTQNAGLDVNGDGIIDDKDLGARLDRANTWPRAREIESRLAALAVAPPPPTAA